MTMAKKEDVPNGVRLVVADVDGTLVTPDKILTPRARAAVRTIVEAGIAFTITSGRPPLGMKPLVDDLQLQDPIAAFNGASFSFPLGDCAVPSPGADCLGLDSPATEGGTDCSYQARRPRSQ